MDMGIAGKTALVCASSKGLGRGCAEALAAEGVHLVMNARNSKDLEVVAEELRSTYEIDITTVACDVTTPEGQSKILESAGSVDILVTNAGGPPPGLWSDWDRDDFIAAIDANMLAPIAILGLSNAARTGLTGYVAGTARQVAEMGVTINNLLPGVHATDRMVALDAGVVLNQDITVEQARKQREATIPVGRYGTREEFGAACAFLCSQHAGFIVGQNILLDGGATNATI